MREQEVTNLKEQIHAQQTIVRGIELAIEELTEAMSAFAGKSQTVWSTLWDKSWELRKEIEKEKYRLQCLRAAAGKPNRDRRRLDIARSMQCQERIIPD